MQQESDPYSLYKQAFYAWYQPLCQYAYTLVPNAPECEDMVQEIFLHVWEKKRELVGQESLRFYLFTATRNRCLNHIRRSRNTQFTELDDLNYPVDTASGHDQEPAVNLAGAVSEALGRLPDRCREVFVLSRMSQLTYQQIADTLGISVKTVDNQIGKALKIMRSFVQEKQLFRMILLMISLWLTRGIGVSALYWFSQ